MKVIKLLSEIFKDIIESTEVASFIFLIVGGLIFMGIGELLKYILGDLYFAYFMASLFMILISGMFCRSMYCFCRYIKRKWKSLD
jgi:hypothetical protein